MQFSVIIPTYKNKYNVLRRAIDSVMNQNTESEFEIIIVDDNDDNAYKGNTKNIESELSDFNYIKFFYNNINRKQCYSRNRGVRVAQGDYVLFLDADDYWYPDYIESLHKLLINKSLSFIFSNYIIYNGLRYKKIDLMIDFKNLKLDEILLDRFGPPSSICIKRDLLLEIGGFDVNLPAREDWDCWLRALINLDINQIAKNETYSVVIIRDGHDSVSSHSSQNALGTHIVVSKIIRSGILSDIQIDRLLRIEEVEIAKHYLLSNNFINFFSFYKKSTSLKRTPLTLVRLFYIYLYENIKHQIKILLFSRTSNKCNSEI